MMEKHTRMGIVGLVFGIISICSFVYISSLPASYIPHSFVDIVVPAFFILYTISGVVAIIIGALAHKKMNKIGKVCILLGIIPLLITGAMYLYLNLSTPLDYDIEVHFSAPCIDFQMDKNAGNLTVDQIRFDHDEYLIDLDWYHVGIRSGNATLPFGTIEVGDVITNCTGNVKLMWIPLDYCLGNWNFT